MSGATAAQVIVPARCSGSTSKEKRGADAQGGAELIKVGYVGRSDGRRSTAVEPRLRQPLVCTSDADDGGAPTNTAIGGDSHRL